MPLIDFYNSIPEKEQTDFRKSSFIPVDISLEIKDFGKFYESRKILLKDTIRNLLVSTK